MADTPRIKMRALAPLITIAGKTVAVGEVFEVSPVEAAAHKYRHRAVLLPKDYQETDDDPPKRRYRRRDLTPDEP